MAEPFKMRPFRGPQTRGDQNEPTAKGAQGTAHGPARAHRVLVASPDRRRAILTDQKMRRAV